mgnify:CR=1 FL=1
MTRKERLHRAGITLLFALQQRKQLHHPAGIPTRAPHHFQADAIRLANDTVVAYVNSPVGTSAQELLAARAVVEDVPIIDFVNYVQADAVKTADVVMSGGTVDVDMRMRNRLTHSFAVKLLTNAVDALFNAAGGSALGMHHPLQRFWRDIHAVSSHISLNLDVVSAMYGQHVFGLEPRGQY